MYVLLIFLIFTNGNASFDQVDGFSTYATCEKVAHEISDKQSPKNTPMIRAKCIEVQ